jgi:DNA-binding transcriptional ArsR family regulator
MGRPFEDLADLDRLVHEPARLAILTALQAGQDADFLFLQRMTGLSKGNLSSHLAKLGEAGLVLIIKSFVGKVPHTRVALTSQGRTQIEDYWKTMDRLRKESRKESRKWRGR